MIVAPTAKIFPWAKLVDDAGVLSIGDHTQIDDFVFLNAGRRCELGRFVHLASFVSVVGGGELVIEDFSGLSAGVRVITGSDDYSGPFLTNPTVPRDLTHYKLSHVHLERHVIVGTNAILYPGVTLPEGVAIGAGCHVRRRLEPWGVYAGEPLRKIAERDAAAIQAKARLALERAGLSPG